MKQTRIQYTRIEAWYMLALLNDNASILDKSKHHDVLTMNTKLRAKLMQAIDRLTDPTLKEEIMEKYNDAFPHIK